MLIQVYCDGASRGQGQKTTGEAACATVVYKNGREIARYARGLGKRTNNEAEYEALITSLLICSMADLYDPIIYSDSAVVVNQVNGKWECRNEHLLPLWQSVKIIQEEFRFRLEQVPRKVVAEPDFYANQFLDSLQEYKLKLQGESKT